MKISAGQLIFTRLPYSESPHHIDGYQTVYWSKELITRQEVDEIEKRLIYYFDDGEPKIKKQFFITHSDKVVVSQSLPVEGERDEVRITRVYLSHCYIINLADFSLIQNNPFYLLENLPYLGNITEAKLAGNHQTGNISPISIDISSLISFDYLLPSVSEWEKEKIYTLIALAANAQILRESRQMVQFCGDYLDIENLLKFTMSLISPTRRLNCWFDTFYYGCNLPPGSYWVVGLPTLTFGETLISIDIEKKEMRAFGNSFIEH